MNTGVGHHALLHAVLGSLVKPLNFPESLYWTETPPEFLLSSRKSS